MLEMKERFSNVTSSGTGKNAGSYPVVPWDLDLKVKHQRTYSEEHPLFHFVELEKVRRRMPEFWIDFMSRQDLGGPFTTEKAEMWSNYGPMVRSGFYFSTNFPWSWSLQQGPLTLAGFEHPLSLSTSQEITDNDALLFALGGTAISRVRPGKPAANLATAIGELKKDGLPSVIGSLYARSKNIRDVFRNSGNEYLNAQFGWVPLLKDLNDVCQVVTSTRQLLQAHEKQLNKLLKRTYRFDAVRDTTEGLSSPMSSYEIHPAQQGGVFSYCRFGTTTGNQVPIETKHSVTKSHFSGGFRFYYPEIDTALNALMEFEHDANTLLGTRLDPEILWNLAPWTWLIDWFVNFGDVIGNLSAIISDGLVIQYAYLMQEQVVTQEITLPRGLFTRQLTGMRPDNLPFTLVRKYTRKRRVKASPFGFGLTPEMFTPQQWAILAALGISRGLK